jgi:phenylacetate-CoA ligase
MWTYALKYSLRSLGRELGRNFWGRHLIYPRLVANERSATALAAYVARRAGTLRIPVPPTGLATLGPGAPALTKAELRADPARQLRARRPGSLLRTTIRTSGTSGSPLTLVQDLGATVREEAFIHRQLRWIGYRHGQRRAWIRGDIVCPERPADGRYWCRDWVANMLMMSSYHLSNATIGSYIAELERFEPVVIHAYPSSVAALAAWLAAAGRRYRGAALRGIMTSSETLAPAVRGAVQRAFGVPVFDWYGLAERVAAIGTCEHGRYHVLTDYGGVELIDGGDGSAELVGTSLNNAAMPLRRYRTGDRVIPDGAPCPCGRVFPTVQAVLGRQERSIGLPDGRMVGRLDRVFHGFDRRLLEGQVRYRGGARFALRIVATAQFTAADAEALVARFLLRVPGVQVCVERAAAIERGPNGKFEFIVIEP